MIDETIEVTMPEKMRKIIEIATNLTPEDIIKQIYYEILNDNKKYRKISVAEAAQCMNKSKQFVRLGLQRGELPFGAAVKMTGEKYSYYISPKRFYEFVGQFPEDDD